MQAGASAAAEGADGLPSIVFETLKRYISSSEESEDAMRKRLKKDHNVTTIEDVVGMNNTDMAKAFKLGDFAADSFRQSLSGEVQILFKRETELQGRSPIFLSSGKFDRAALNHYEPDASTFRAPSSDSTKTPMYRAFLGPSGSGKSLSALKVPFNHDSDAKFGCTVYIAASTLMADFSDTMFDEDNKKGEVFIGKAEAAVKEALKINEEPLETGQTLQIVLHLVIDEAGFNEVYLEDFDWSLSRVDTLRHRLKKYVQEVLVTAAGTNLDSVLSRTVDSGVDSVAKYRASPWQSDNALAIVAGTMERLKREAPAAMQWPNVSDAKSKLAGWIEEIPVFKSLQTNGRAAFKLISTLLWLMAEGRDATHLIRFVVDAVSKFYIGQNGLRSLSRLQKRMVVKAVLQVLTKEDIEVAAPASFEIEHDLLCHCLGIVDFNVERVNGKYKYIDETWKCPCRVSACLTIVLFELLGFASELATDWASFETVCTLALIQNAVLSTDANAGTDEEEEVFRLIEMSTPFPSGSAVVSGFVPVIGPYDVVRNGPAAPHGDAFGHNEITQSRHSLNRGNAKCFFWEELYKCGLLKDDNSVHAATTALMHAQWNEKDTLAAYVANDVKMEADSKPTRNGMYPASLLEVARADDYDIVKFSFDPNSEKWILPGGQEVSIPNDFLSAAITFSVCTNADSLTLQLKSYSSPARREAIDELLSAPEPDSQATAASDASEGSVYDPFEVTICPGDVNFHGALHPGKLQKLINQNLKEGVALRFRFCRGA